MKRESCDYYSEIEWIHYYYCISYCCSYHLPSFLQCLFMLGIFVNTYYASHKLHILTIRMFIVHEEIVNLDTLLSWERKSCLLTRKNVNLSKIVVTYMKIYRISKSLLCHLLFSCPCFIDYGKSQYWFVHIVTYNEWTKLELLHQVGSYWSAKFLICGWITDNSLSFQSLFGWNEMLSL